MAEIVAVEIEAVRPTTVPTGEVVEPVVVTNRNALITLLLTLQLKELEPVRVIPLTVTVEAVVFVEKILTVSPGEPELPPPIILLR